MPDRQIKIENFTQPFRIFHIKIRNSMQQKQYTKYGTGRIARYIELIDRILRESDKSISSQYIIDRYKQEYQDEAQAVSPKAGDNKDLIKAKNKIKECLKSRGMAFIEQKGGDKRKTLFRYPDNVPEDLLEPLCRETKKLRQKTLTDLLQNSQGLFPDTWLTKFRLQAEEEININETPFIEFDANEQLKNLDLLPTFYYAVRDKKVLSFDYKPYDKPKRRLIFHPHYLKEYNLRWFVFGLAIDERGGQYPNNNCALDRIVSEIEEAKGMNYIPSNIDYTTYFDDIIGVTHPKNAKKELIKIVTKNFYTHQRILTKRLHKSQNELRPWNRETHTGLFSIEVIPNYELLGLLMSFEGNIEVYGNYRKCFVSQVNRMYNLYKK